MDFSRYAFPSFTAPDVSWILPSPFAWCAIPEGRVRLADFAQTTFEVAPFYIAEVPVTAEQFQVFLDAPDGFYEDQWWHGLAVDADSRSAPGDQAFTHAANLPREMVSWYDAVAFCRWLSAQVGEELRLPTEWEWQWAAQAPYGQEFPWGQRFDSSCCNTRESGIGQTTPVDWYPSGASPCEVLDLSGNVWEWCLNEYTNLEETDLGGTELRVVRGGSWVFFQGGARADFRGRLSPELRRNFCGFRMVIAPRSF